MIVMPLNLLKHFGVVIPMVRYIMLLCNYSVAKANTEKGWFINASLIAKNADHPVFRAVLTKDMIVAKSLAPSHVLTCLPAGRSILKLLVSL